MNGPLEPSKDSGIDKFGKVRDFERIENEWYKHYVSYAQYRIPIREAERCNGLPENSLRAVLKFDPLIIKGIGRHQIGAIGIAGLMPHIAHRFGVKNRLDPHESIAGAGRYLAYLYREFGDLKRAQAAFATTEERETI